MNNAFLTGSQCYGRPTDDSDIDLVILVDEKTAEFLWSNSDDEKSSSQKCCFGALNLIVCTTQAQYDRWRIGTEALLHVKPVSHKRACHLLEALNCAGDTRQAAALHKLDDGPKLKEGLIS
jgi:hypothetical protein